jgi:DNA-binding MarR family transcriptional regulator
MPRVATRRRAAPPPLPAPRGCTSFKLRALTRRVGQHYDQAMAAVGLKTTQYSLLSHVFRQGPVGSAALAASMALSASTLSRNLRPLIAAGWVELQPGADARSHLVAITDAGRAKRSQAQRQWRGAQESLNRRLGLPMVAALHELIDQALPLLEPSADAEDPEDPEDHT